jgi:DNA-binding NarL/FixJ family response regulator
MKVLLVDDHPLILSALQTMLEAMADGITVLTADSAAAMHAVLAHELDLQLVLLDLTLGDAEGFSTLEVLRERHPELPVVLVSATDHMADVVRAIDLGAMGFVPKRSSNVELHGALALVMSGSVYIPPALLGLVNLPGAGGEPRGWAGVVAQMASGSSASASASSPAGAPASAATGAGASLATAAADAGAVAGLVSGQAGLSALAAQASAGYAALGLTPRQSDVLGLLLKGLPNKLIARELSLSVETVKDHVAAVLRTLGVSSRTQAVLAVGQMQQQASSLRGAPLR